MTSLLAVRLTALCLAYETLFEKPGDALETEVDCGISSEDRWPILQIMQCLLDFTLIGRRLNRTQSHTFSLVRTVLFALAPLMVFTAGPLTAHAKGKDKNKISYGEGLIVNIPSPENEVEQVVQDVAQNGVIRGTKEYNKDQFVSGAKAADSNDVFPAWEQGGTVFYKVREQAIDPRGFKDSNDVGALVVRYVVQPQGSKNTVLRIDALFKEDFRRVAHESDGSVENAEYKDIREHLESIEVMKQQDREAKEQRELKLAKKNGAVAQNNADATPAMQSSSRSDSQRVDIEDVEKSPEGNSATKIAPAQADEGSGSGPVSAGQTSIGPSSVDQNAVGQTPAGQTLEQRIQEVRKQVGRVVKPPGAPLKSAPFHTASTLVLMSPGAEVLIVISTPYWYGVETHEGQHGWMMRDQLELP
jgi:hypothetical protein